MSASTLLVVIDPTVDVQIALQRAEQIAVDNSAKLHLFCCDYLEDISQYSSKKDAKHSVLTENKQAMEALASPLRKEGLKITTESCWNKNWQESAIHACTRIGADLMIKSSSSHTLLERKLKKTSDFTLLRQSPCAVLLVKNGAPWMEQTLVAALALDTEDPAHHRLNNAIMTQAQRLAQATQSTLHIVAALENKSDIADALKIVDSDEEQSHEELISARFGIDESRIHIEKGKARDIITKAASQLRADALIIGTVARQGIPGVLLGNTAEKILDQLEMDILVVN